MSLQNSCADDIFKCERTLKSAFTNRILSVSYENANKECLMLEVFLTEVLQSLQDEVITFLKVNIAMKFNIELHAVYTKPYMSVIDSSTIQTKIFKTGMQESFNIKEFLQKYSLQVKKLKRLTEAFQTKEGGWSLLHLAKADFKLTKYQPLKGAGFIDLPRSLKLKQACINVQNKDEFCFKWAVVAAFAGINKRSYQTSSYKVNIKAKIIQVKDLQLNFKELTFPLQIKDVAIFEKNNPQISINVFGYDELSDLVIGPYYKTSKKKLHHVNLLYLDENNIGGHYVWIKNFSRLIRSQITANKNKIIICDACLQHFSEDHYKEKHMENCGKKGDYIIWNEKCALEFKNSIKVVDVPFVIYASLNRCSKNALTSNSMLYVCTYFVKCNYNNSLNKWCIFKGSNAPREFAESLIKDAEYYYRNYSTVIKPKVALSQEEELEFQNNNSCCLCSKDVYGDFKVKLHCRLTGKYMGPAHHACALNFKVPKKFPVIFPNLSIEDSLLVIKQLSDIDNDVINARPLNNESYISFEKDIKVDIGKIELRFLNFTSFLSGGLRSFQKSMTDADFKTLKLTYPEESKFKLAFTKLIFPYHYLHSTDQLQENCLPSIERFYDSVLDSPCTPESYAHAQHMWRSFECTTLDDYLSMCLKIDILLLADVFEQFRLVCRNAYNLDPCHYYSAAEFSWDAMLKVTDIKLNLPTEEGMCKFLEKGMRVGVSKCFQRRSVANNKYIYGYDSQLPTKYLMYFQANDLYCRVMTDYLPVGNFQWESDLNISLDSIADDSEYGYIFDVDLEYPSSTFEAHKQLPFCGERVTLADTNEKQLMMDMSNKFHYIIYYKNLQQCLKHGLKLTKVNRILKFKQSNWLKKYIELNKTPNSKNNNAFGVKVLQSMNTALYEKIMEKPETKIKIIDKWESDGRRLGARAFIVKPDFSSFQSHDENLVAIEYNTSVFKHVPVYLEFVISELVKLKIYSFHYDYILPKYNTNAQLNYIDTDSLIYTITTDDLYQDLANDLHAMFQATDRDYSELLVRTLGIMQTGNDEALKEFIGFRSKLYALKTEAMLEVSEEYGITNASLLLLLFKAKLYRRYAALHQQELPLDYSNDNVSILSNDIVNRLGWLYYPVCENDSNKENLMDND